MAKQDDGLFLIEALVDKVTFKKSPCFSDKDFRTCIKIECPSVEPLEICDDDPGSCAAKSGGPFTKSFNAGKSCLFSLSQADIGKAMSSFPIKVTAYKSLPCGCIPAVIVIGEATIDMTKEFVKARNQFLADPTNVSYEALQDKFRLLGTDKEDAGEVTMFLRISCFGKLIITKFQGAGGPPTLGTGGGSQVVDRSCSGPRAFQTPKDPCVCGASRDAAAHQKGASTSAPCSAPCRMGENKAVCPPAKDPYGSMPCEEDDPCYCSGPHPHKKQDMACKNTAEYCLHVPKGPNKNFEEIGTNLGGNELKIRVPAEAAIIKRISQTHCAIQRPYVKENKAQKEKQDGPCVTPCGKNKISLCLPKDNICCNDGRPQGTQFSCTTEGCVMATKHGQQAAFARGDVSSQSPNKDVFVLKVAKTAVHYDKKCKIEFEVVAPKGANKNPPVRKENVALVTESPCGCCPVRRLKPVPRVSQPQQQQTQS